MEEPIKDLREKFGRYFQGFQDKNEEKSKKVAEKELAALYESIND